MVLKKKFKYLLAIIFFIPVFLLCFKVWKIDMLPLNMYLIVVAILVSLSTIANICLFIKRKWTKPITILIYIVLAFISIVGIKGLGDASDFLDEHFENAKNTYDLTYYVLSQNKYKESDLVNKDVYYYEFTDHIDEVLPKIKEKLNVNMKSIDSVERLIKSDIFLIDSSSYDLQVEEGKMKKNKYQVIYELKMTFKEETDVQEENPQNNGGLTTTKKKKQKDPDVLNIYVGGYDFSGVRMDFNALITLNMRTHKLLVTSIPRDYYLYIPGKKVKDTLSTMSPYGVKNNVRAVENMLNVSIDYYLIVETTGLVELVDSIGGITYCSDKAYTTDHALVIGTYDDTKGEHLDVIKGCQELNGIETLTVARERKAYATQDIARTKNDAKIMNAILSKMKSPTIAVRYNAILSAVGGMYTTTMPKEVVQDGVKSLLGSKWTIKNQYMTGVTDWGTCQLSGTYKYVMTPSVSSVNAARKAISEI